MVMKIASPKNATSLAEVFQKVYSNFGSGSYGDGTHIHQSQNMIKYYVHEEKDVFEEEDGTMELVQFAGERTKNVLILMSDTGGGHGASAEAIHDAFKLEFGDEYRIIIKKKKKS